MQTRTQAFALGMLALAVVGCDPLVIAGVNVPVVGSGRVVSETRPITDVREVVLSGFGRIVIVQGRRPGLVVTAEDNLLPLITTHASGRRLTVATGAAIQPRRDIVVHVTVRDLDDLVISGAGEAAIPHLTTEFLHIVISGSGTVTVGGFAREQRVLLSGDGQYLGEQLESRYARVEVSGDGYARVWVRDALDALVSGSGVIEFYGRPLIRQTVSGSGAVVWRGP
jgi:mannose-6-phosphate isomerase-like protein (cupin superfamily)